MVKGTTTLAGIIGHPVSHSLSPAMHNAAFIALGMDWIYVPLSVHPKDLRDAVNGLRSLGFRGVNVTVPHKERVIPFLQEISEHAAGIGAVNTIKVAEGRLLGDNTDWLGFVNHLAEIGFDPAGHRALILGSGGSARAVVYALLSHGAAVTVCGRNRETTRSLVEHFSMLFPAAAIEALHATDLENRPVEADIVVNTTPSGMAPHEESSPWPEGVAFPRCGLVYDLVYSPAVTRFMELARSSGVSAVNGLGMLVHQAAAAFEIWTGAPAPIDVMRKALTSC